MPSDATASTPARPVSRRLRFEILRRDGHTCRYCGANAPDVKLTVDHVIPVALGGSNDPTNLVTACVACNGGKTSTSPDSTTVAEVDAKALQWANALERAAEIRRAVIDDTNEATTEAIAAWDNWHDAAGNTVPADSRREHSMALFLSLGLTQKDIAHFIKVAMESKAKIDAKWRYFCGCCWREITERQTLAASLLANDPATPHDGAEDDDPGYAAGFDDGYAYGVTRGREQIAEEQRSYDEGYTDGFRRAAQRLSRYEADQSDFDESNQEWGQL